MTKFGDWPTTSEMGPQEDWAIVVPATGTADTGAGMNIAIGSYTMPFTGRLMAEFKARCGWTPDSVYYRAQLNVSSPTPSRNSAHAVWTGFPGGYWTTKEMPLTAVWDSLAQGTVVTFIANVSSNVGVRVFALGGLVRASPL